MVCGVRTIPAQIRHQSPFSPVLDFVESFVASALVNGIRLQNWKSSPSSIAFTIFVKGTGSAENL